jgi:Tfp pilus assembly protein PilE
VTACSQPIDERDQRGETLVEVVISILVMSIVFVAVMAGFGTSIGISAIHKQQATAQAIARDFGEYLEYNNAVGYNSSCPASYSSAATSIASAYQLPGGGQPLVGASPDYTVQVTAVDYISPYVAGQQDFSGTCGLQLGVQRISLKVSSTHYPSVFQTLQVVKRK